MSPEVPPSRKERLLSTFVWGGSAILLREHEKTRGVAVPRR